MGEYVDFTLNNIFVYISLLSPFLIIFYFFMISFFFNDAGLSIARFIFYIIGLLGTMFLSYIFSQNLNTKRLETEGIICKLLPLPLPIKEFISPYIYSSIAGYNIGYIVLATMVLNITNIYYTSLILFVTAINIVLDIINHCSTLYGIFLGLLFGISIGIVYGFIIYEYNNKLLYANNENCNKVKKIYKTDIFEDLVKQI